MSNNPYQSSPLAATTSYSGGEDPKLDRTANMLSQTRPWVRLISVLMFIGSGLMVLAGLLMMVTGGAGAFAGGGGGAAMAGGAAAFAGVFYIIFALLYIVPASFLWKYANAISLFSQNRSTGALASALEAQKSFWKFVGIVTVIVLVIYIIIFGLMFVAIAMSAV